MKAYRVKLEIYVEITNTELITNYIAQGWRVLKHCECCSFMVTLYKWAVVKTERSNLDAYIEAIHSMQGDIIINEYHECDATEANV